MVENSITLLAAYMIENLRQEGVSNEEIAQINEERVEAWKDFDMDFDFNVLKELAEADKEAFESIVFEGYQVKFLTLNGLINLVQLKFDKERDTDFTVHDDGISHLKLEENQYVKLKQFLSQNWRVTEEAGLLSIRSVVS